MARYVIDAPTLLRLVEDDVRVDPDVQLVAPSSIRSEALQLLLREVAAGTRTEESALERHARLTTLRIRVLGDRVSRATAWKIARRRGWDSLREAEYLALTLLQADALVTVDPELVAKADDVAAVAPLEALLTPG